MTKALTAPELVAAIAAILTRHKGLVLTHHARQRALERGFTVDDVVRVLTSGCLVQTAFDDQHHVWKYSIAGRGFDNEPLTVVVAIEDNRIVVITGHE